jgi:hypothetical protein
MNFNKKSTLLYHLFFIKIYLFFNEKRRRGDSQVSSVSFL